jgi:uncharacterized RDD family membrane protein YckC
MRDAARDHIGDSMTTIPPYALAAAPAASRTRAGFWKRVAGFVLDAISINLLAIPVYFVPYPAVSTVCFIVVWVTYFTLLDGGPNGQTIGRMALEIRVVDIDSGEPIGYARGLIRTLGRLPSELVLFLGYFWMLWDGEKQGWHDKLARSVVVPAN